VTSSKEAEYPEQKGEDFFFLEYGTNAEKTNQFLLKELKNC